MLRNDACYRCIGTDEVNGILACGYIKKGKEFSQRNFSLPFYGCFVLLQGSGVFIDERGVKTALFPGCVVQRPPGYRHSTLVDENSGWYEFFVCFGKSSYEALAALQALPTKERVGKIALPAHTQEWDSLLEKLKVSSEENLPFLLLECQRTVMEWFSAGSLMASSNKTMLQQACLLLSQNLHLPLTGREVANVLHIGYESFRKQFRQEMGISPNAYRIDKKMEQARIQLISGLPQEEVAHHLGYCDTSSFSKQFSKIHSVSPSQYRKANKART